MTAETATLSPVEESGARATILEATSTLLQTETLDELSVAQILTQAGLARATFYHYFASKDDAFLALLNEFMAAYVPRFEAIVGDVERRRSAAFRDDIAQWLDIEAPHAVILRSAVEEWPRRAELRTAYLAGQKRLADCLAKAITADRRAGVAAQSVPAALLATGWIWMMERSWYEAAGGATHLGDLPAVRDALAATLVSAIYAR